MKKLVKPKRILTIRCPTCGAPPGQKCKVTTGKARVEPHPARQFAFKLRPV